MFFRFLQKNLNTGGKKFYEKNFRRIVLQICYLQPILKKNYVVFQRTHPFVGKEQIAYLLKTLTFSITFCIKFATIW